MAYQVILPAAGQGKRMGAGKNKLLLELNGIPVLIHTLKVFEEDELCDGMILAVHPQDFEEFNVLLKKYNIHKVTGLVPGGKERQYSIYNALKTVTNGSIILVHDAARPFIRKEQIHRLIETAKKTGAAIIGVPAKDTMKKVQVGTVVETVERSSLWAVQTPQAFRISLLLEAYQKAEMERFVGTDDSSLVERLGHPVAIVEGDYDNIKLTTPEDLYFAEAILKKRQAPGTL
ncbi:2-C-methyl-D-erythritol 4-phosphate cytidylyltransferase [Neobacillus thermocopriae]|uniref:2-C-methyl-D-erythritol 4-phosphate cytidylyltransferase n=1 Tax=Neobacillus thermocopriae TaxID=1215031 RepID=A0A6B3TSI2_9BACI|nr:2-C-methyl-D-erythritol 4-phosphate cytidylyltransferase [Neobacillus thermocopriae]MED3624841.1 2-C-methyl-D-erythritol 4-phosphate cytidylyltransferase [Neobacillus thermocopriae]MED3712698.1 2-C-methyl-D-erythritol 4-phosphate cytidylyltransferase [Neobacillus thermocopriae]NEX79410.1 2-C-methyl-D-erythritol 4-phosphate cytidylyltransferase [Neobacillus thermocopriae]